MKTNGQGCCMVANDVRASETWFIVLFKKTRLRSMKCFGERRRLQSRYHLVQECACVWFLHLGARKVSQVGKSKASKTNMKLPHMLVEDARTW